MSEDPTSDVARLLLEQWDPLRVAEADVAPEQEYVHEAGRVVALLQRGADVEEVTAHLTTAVAELSHYNDVDRDRRVAGALLEWQSDRA
jgi:phosphoribosylamine-glycine ligase